MSNSYELTQLTPSSFEHMVNFLALKVLGAGATGFGPGPDGGRDGLFEGEAPYPSQTNSWSGTWYIQSKFHAPHLSKNSQKWLCEQISNEVDLFQAQGTNRRLPNNWIIATNIDPSGAPNTGAYDTAKKIVEDRLGKNINFHIWGGRKILDQLSLHQEVASAYGHFLTPGHVLTALNDHVKDASASADAIINYLVVNQFNEQLYTKLDQAGSSGDSRPKIHDLFIDLPFSVIGKELDGFVLEQLCKTSSQCHRTITSQLYTDAWHEWSTHPSRARVWILKGGPGQGKSTAGQYFSQIHRAALILTSESLKVLPKVRAVAREIRRAAEEYGVWPTVPRIPVLIELKDFAQWYGGRGKGESAGILTYLAARIEQKVEQVVLPGTLKRAIGAQGWFFAFDGLDEVPNDVKDDVAGEIIKFLNELIPSIDADVVALCTSRPQGYSGQFSQLDGPVVTLNSLDPDTAIRCAKPVACLDRTDEECERAMATLRAAIESDGVRELMTTPLQSHIMAIVVRDGGRPPERRWQLFENFYQVMKKRETLKNFPDLRVARLLREDEKLLKEIHNRLGFVLHSRAESSGGADTSLDRGEFRVLARQAVDQMSDADPEETVDVLMEATTERLVFVSTPESAGSVRFDVRQLQEFFAAEFVYQSATVDQLRERMELIAGDAHWSEVMHFVLSALVENSRATELAVAAEVLVSLNSDVDDEYIRVFKKRMARGAILAMRLLQEGVLEQDKRIRTNFREMLSPIQSMLEIDGGGYLDSVSHKNSRAWWTNCLIDSLFEASESENICSAIMLATTIGDDHPKVDVVREFMRDASHEYFFAVFDAVQAPITANKSYVIGGWLLEELTLRLLRNDWYKISKDAFSAAVRVLGAVSGRLDEVGIRLGLSGTEVSMLKILGLDSVNFTNIINRKDRDYGLVAMTHFECDWTTASKGSFHGLAIGDVISPARGVVNLVSAILRFSFTRKWDDFRYALLVMEKCPQVVGALPRELTANFPFRVFETDKGCQVSSLLRINEEDFDRLMRFKKISDAEVIRPTSFVSIDSGAVSVEGFCRLSRDYPALAISFWFGRDIFYSLRKKGAFLNTREVALAIADAIVRYPRLALPHILEWGMLFNILPEREGELRSALLLAARDVGEAVEYESLFSVEETRPFSISLSQEVEFLPWLVGCFLNTRGYSQIHEFGEAVDSDRWPLGFPLDDAELRSIARSDSRPKHIRAAALIALLMMPGFGASAFSSPSAFVEEWEQLILELYNVAYSGWYVKGLTRALNAGFAVESPLVMRMIGKLIDSIKADFESRRDLGGLLADLRERSAAPVQRNDVLEKWLSGEA